MKKLLFRIGLSCFSDKHVMSLYLSIHFQLLPSVQKAERQYWVEHLTVLGMDDQYIEDHASSLAEHFAGEAARLTELRTRIIDARPRLFKGYRRVYKTNYALGVLWTSRPEHRAYKAILAAREAVQKGYQRQK